MRSYVIVQRSNNLAATAKQEILGTPYTRFFLSMVMVVQHFKTKVYLKEKITERYPGEVYQGISRCVERRSITRALVGTQCTGGLAHTSGRKLPNTY